MSDPMCFPSSQTILANFETHPLTKTYFKDAKYKEIFNDVAENFQNSKKNNEVLDDTITIVAKLLQDPDRHQLFYIFKSITTALLDDIKPLDEIKHQRA